MDAKFIQFGQANKELVFGIRHQGTWDESVVWALEFYT
jgi:hypothetical protein